MTGTLIETDDDTPVTGPRSRRRLILIVLAAVVVLAVFATWLVAFSSAFGVRRVVVRGVPVAGAAQVERAAAVKHGTPLVRLDTGAVASRVERLGDVLSTQVSTSFPSTVTITVQERYAVGYVEVAGRDMLVDRTGDQYRSVDKPPSGLPRFVVPSGTDARNTGGAVATVAAALPASVRREVTSIDALDPGAITLVLTHGRAVAWGSAARSPAKAQVLPALLATGADQVNVTNPDQPFTR